MTCAEGMVISTRSPRVLKARQATMELLLTSHTGSCVTDTEARECTLHRLASDMEISPPRFYVRCGTYPQHPKAVAEAAELLRGG